MTCILASNSCKSNDNKIPDVVDIALEFRVSFVDVITEVFIEQLNLRLFGIIESVLH
jgi:hypothetical protein